MHLDITAKHLTKAKIFVGCPMYDGRCHAEFTFALCQLSALCTKLGIGLQLYFASGEALVMKARNAIADQFLQSDATHCMLIDGDIGFQATDVLSLLALQMGDDSASADHNAFDVVSAPYPIKRITWDRLAAAVKRGMAEGNAGALQYVATDLLLRPAQSGTFDIAQPLEVTEAGTGFMMIRRRTLEAFQAQYPHRRYKSEAIGIGRDCSPVVTQFFDTAIDGQADTLEDDLRLFMGANPDASHDAIRKFLSTRAENYQEYVSEDFMFCRLVRRMGLKLWSCPWMELSHIGSHNFNSRLKDLARLGPI